MAQSIERPDVHPVADARSDERRLTREPATARGRGLSIERYFTRPGIDPMAEVEWDLRSALISGEDGRVVFEQSDVEVPAQLVADRHECGRVEVLPRTSRQSAARN